MCNAMSDIFFLAVGVMLTGIGLILVTAKILTYIKCTGARVLTGLIQKWRKIKGFRHSIIDNNLIYMHHCIYLILKKHSKKEKNLIKIGTRNDTIRRNEWCCFYIQK